MVDDFEIADISNVYKDMDSEGKKKMIQAAKKLLDGQLVLKDKNILSEVKKENTKFKN